VRTKRRRKKGVYDRRVVGKNCRHLVRAGGKALCGLRDGEPCSKKRGCGYEEESRTMERLRKAL